MRVCCESIEVIYELEMTDDWLQQEADSGQKPAQRRSRHGSPPVPGNVQAGNRAGRDGDPLLSFGHTNCRDGLPNTADRTPVAISTTDSERPSSIRSATTPPPHLPHSGSRTRM